MDGSINVLSKFLFAHRMTQALVWGYCAEGSSLAENPNPCTTTNNDRIMYVHLCVCNLL